MATNELAKVISLADHKRQIEIKDTITEIRRVKGLMTIRFTEHLKMNEFYEKYLIELKLSGKVIMPFTKFSDLLFGGEPTGAMIWIELPNEEFIGSMAVTFRHVDTNNTFKRYIC